MPFVGHSAQMMDLGCLCNALGLALRYRITLNAELVVALVVGVFRLGHRATAAGRQASTPGRLKSREMPHC